MRRSVWLIAIVSALLAAPMAVYATHSFNDVPASNTFHADIEWLKDSGVTKGCNPPANDEFCPDDPVTRGQMSAFMHRLADLQVVDAGTLDGEEGAAYGNRAVNIINGVDSLPIGTPVQLAELSIVAPADGGLIIDTSVLASTDSASQPGALLFWLQVDATTCMFEVDQLESVMFGFLRLADDLPTSGAAVGTAEVSAGTHMVTLCAATDLDGVGLAASLVAEYATSVARTVAVASIGGLDLPDLFSD